MIYAKVALCLPVILVFPGCGGNLFADAIEDKAKEQANNSALTNMQRGRIFENAANESRSHTGGARVANDLYLKAASAYDRDGTAIADREVIRLRDKCRDLGYSAFGDGCGITEVIADWSPSRRNVAEGTSANFSSRSSAPPNQAANSGTVGSAISDSQIDDAIRQARVVKSSLPPTIAGCPTTVDHLADRLPICARNGALLKLREISLLTDASFTVDQKAGYSLSQIATNSAQAARQYDAALAQSEKAMLSAAAFAGIAEARITAIRATPSRCDAAADNAFGMQESAYQGYVAAYMAAQLNRAVSVIAACRARAAR